MMRNIVVVLGLCVTAASAQDQQSPAGTPKSRLGLSDAQVAQLREMRRMQRESLKPLRDQMRQKARDLRETMRSDNPDATRAGQLMVDLKNLRQQVRRARPDRIKQLQSVLTPEQRAKLREMRSARMKSMDRSARRALRARPAARGMGRMPI